MSNSMAIKNMMDPLMVRAVRAFPPRWRPWLLNFARSRLQAAFCQEAPTSPLCNGAYVFTPSRPGNARPHC